MIHSETPIESSAVLPAKPVRLRLVPYPLDMGRVILTTGWPDAALAVFPANPVKLRRVPCPPDIGRVIRTTGWDDPAAGVLPANEPTRLVP